MQASVRTADRVVVQTGLSLGSRTGCVIVETTAQQETDLRDAFDQPHGNIYLSAAGVVTFDPYVPNPTPPPDPQIAQDKTTVGLFMNAPSGTATPAQRDDTIKAVIRYLRRSWNDG